MEGIHLLWDTLLKGDFMGKINLKDAYLTVPIASQTDWYSHYLTDSSD